jgi:hypothetical protein
MNRDPVNIIRVTGMLKFNGKEVVMIVVQIVAGVLAAAVLGIIVYRRKQKTV